MSLPRPSRGDVWRVDLEPVRGHEQGRVRPCVVVSDDTYNLGAGGSVVAIVPLTTRDRGIPIHVVIEPPDGGLTERSVAKCDQIRAVSIERFSRRHGRLSEQAIHDIEDRLRVFLRL